MRTDAQRSALPEDIPEPQWPNGDSADYFMDLAHICLSEHPDAKRADTKVYYLSLMACDSLAWARQIDLSAKSGTHGVGVDLRRSLPGLEMAIGSDEEKAMQKIKNVYGFDLVQDLKTAIYETTSILQRLGGITKIPQVTLTNYQEAWLDDKAELEHHVYDDTTRVQMLDDQVHNIQEQDKKRFKMEMKKMTLSLRGRMNESLRVIDDFYTQSNEWRQDFWDNFDGQQGSTMDRLMDGFDDLMKARDVSYEKADQGEEQHSELFMTQLRGMIEKAGEGLDYADTVARKTFDQLEQKLEEMAKLKILRIHHMSDAYDKIDDEMRKIYEDVDRETATEEQDNARMWKKSYKDTVLPAEKEYADSAAQQMVDFDDHLTNSDKMVYNVADMAFVDLDKVNKSATNMNGLVGDLTDNLDRGKVMFDAEQNATRYLMESIVKAQADKFRAIAGTDRQEVEVSTRTKIAEQEAENYAKLSDLMTKLVGVGSTAQDKARTLKQGTLDFFKTANERFIKLQGKNHDDENDLDALHGDLDKANSDLKRREGELSAYIDEENQPYLEEIDKLASEANTMHKTLETKAKTLDGLVESDVTKLDGMARGHDAALLPANETFNDAVDALTTAISEHKQDVGKEAMRLLADVQYLFGMAGETSNEVIPALQQYVLSVSKQAYSEVQAAQGRIIQATTDPIALAADARALGESAMRKQQQAMSAYWTKTLGAQGEALQQSDRAVEDDLEDKDKATKSQFAETRRDVAVTEDGATRLGSDMERDEEAIEEATGKLTASVKQFGGADFGAASRAGADQSASWAAFTAALADESDRILEAVTNQGNASISMQEAKLSAVDKTLAAAEATTRSGAQQRAEGLIKEANAQKQTLSNKARELKRSLGALVAHMKGMAANTTEWTDRLKEEIAGEAGELHTQKMLQANSKIELQAAIDKRFGALKEKVNHDVDGLGARQQKMMGELVGKAEAEAQKLLNRDELSQEEKASRLAKINAWLVGNLQSVSSDVGHAGTEFETTVDGIRKFEGEAEARVNGLVAILDADDSKLGLEEDRRSVAVTKMGMQELLEEAEHEVGQAGKAHDRRMDEIHADHGHETEALKKEVLGSQEVFDAELTAAINKVPEAQARIKQEAQSHAAQTADLHREFETFNGESDQLLDQLTTQLAEQTSSRNDRMEALKTWAQGFGLDGAHMEEKLVQATVDLYAAHDSSFRSVKQEFKAAEKRVHAALDSGNAALLKKIMGADKTIDAIAKKDTATEDWIHKYEEGTDHFRKTLAQRLDKLAGGLDNELGELASSTEDFQFSMDQFANATYEDITKEVAETKASDDAAISKLGAELATETGGVAGEVATHMTSSNMEAQQEAAEEKGNFDESEQTETQVQQALTKLTDLIGSERPIAQQAVGHVARALEAKQAEVDAAQEQVKAQLDNVDGILNPDAPEAEEGSPESMLQENLGLNAEHRLLGQELKKLESKYRSLTVNA